MNEFEKLFTEQLKSLTSTFKDINIKSKDFLINFTIIFLLFLIFLYQSNKFIDRITDKFFMKLFEDKFKKLKKLKIKNNFINIQTGILFYELIRFIFILYLFKIIYKIIYYFVNINIYGYI